MYFVATTAWSSPGAIDQYGCHRDKANVYHCHGDLTQAKRIHTLLGVGLKSTNWFYSDGPANIFIGPSLETELAFDAVAIRTGWTYQPLFFAAKDYSLSGWDMGVKIGKGLSRLGKHGFLEVGYFHNQFKQANGNVNLLNGYQLGAGFIFNKENWSFDGKFLFRDASSLSDYWNNEINIPTKVADYSFSIGAYRRF
ncbi:hypothetical protein [Reinekea sp.]|uniref:hypothetical protein n=1 Tax=Reinekea sp. TaxID=1970455 RepID=UPI003989AB99